MSSAAAVGVTSQGVIPTTSAELDRAPITRTQKKQATGDNRTATSRQRTAHLIHGPATERRTDQSRREGTALRLYAPDVERTEQRETKYGVGDLVAGIHRALMRQKNKGDVVDAVAGELQKLLDDPNAIDPALIRTGEERYSRTLLYRDPRQRFIVALLTWKPGQQSPIHDHECWGAVGVYRGALTEVRYDREGRGLTAGPAETFNNGAISKMKPPEPDLHTMGNQTDDLTVTIHVYGRDMRDANIYDPETGASERKSISFDYFGPLAQRD